MIREHEQQVRERAYFIWEDEGRAFGRAEAHWFQAEAELSAAAVGTVPTVEPVAETGIGKTSIGTSVPTPAKVLKPAAIRAKAKAEKAPAKAAKKAETPKAALDKAALKARRAPRAAESAAALH